MCLGKHIGAEVHEDGLICNPLQGGDTSLASVLKAGKHQNPTPTVSRVYIQLCKLYPIKRSISKQILQLLEVIALTSGSALPGALHRKKKSFSRCVNSILVT